MYSEQCAAFVQVVVALSCNLTSEYVAAADDKIMLGIFTPPTYTGMVFDL